MANVIAIIGAGHGDEGKGLMTDYFSSLYDDAVVIRSNGGSQAGHTVVTPEGQRHAFSHFGSGTFNGSSTFLSKHFVINPMVFEKEHREFVEKFGIMPKILVDPRCIVTTPYDMLINQQFEYRRGLAKHGSCGIGFGETLERQLVHSQITLDEFSGAYNRSYKELKYRTIAELEAVRDVYCPTRMNIGEMSDEFKSIFFNEKLISDFVDTIEYMLNHVSFIIPFNLKSNNLVFEGAQGLLLDMDYGYFPHVTRSNCGMKNISEILTEIDGKHDITVNYVTRAYTTRHGAGPLAYEKEWDIKERYNIVDETNIPNEHQGTLRFAPLDLDLFNSITDKDFLNHAPRGSKKNIVMTCMDQLSDADVITYRKRASYRTERLQRQSKEVFISNMNKFADYLSYGPMSEDVYKTDKK